MFIKGKNQKEIKCTCCSSTKIMRFNLNSEWVRDFPVGNYHVVNSKEHYTLDELKLGIFDIPNIDLYHCLNCRSFFT